MSVAGTCRLAWHRVLEELYHAAATCSARWDSRSLGNVSLLLQMLAHCQPSPAGVVTVTRPRHIWCGVELLTAKLIWVLPSSGIRKGVWKCFSVEVLGLPRRDVYVSVRLAFHSAVLRVKQQVLPAGNRLCVELHGHSSSSGPSGTTAP